MVLTMLPANVFASDTQEPATVYLPITDAEPVLSSSISPSVSETNTIYASIKDLSVQLPDFSLSEDSFLPCTGARVQAVDSAGNIVGQTAGFTLYDFSDELDGCELFFLKTLPAGNYTLQLICGSTENVSVFKLDSVLSVVDAPIIQYGSMNLVAGTAPSELELRLVGYNGNPNIYSFTLINEETEENIPCSAQLSNYRKAADYSSLTYLLTPKTPLTADCNYILAISVSEGILYSTANTISSSAEEMPEASGFAILEVTPDSNTVGGLTIKTGGVTENTTYTIQASISSSFDSAPLFSGNCTPVNTDGVGTFSIGLQFNGIALPLSAYGSTYISISISDDHGNYDSFGYQYSRYVSTYTDLELKQNENSGYDFVLEGHNILLDLYDQTEPLTFTLKRYDNDTQCYITVSSICSAVEKSSSVKNDDTIWTFTGTFTVSSPLDATTYYYLFNGDENLAIARPTQSSTAGDDTNQLYFSHFYSPQIRSQKIYFNFGYLPVEISLGNCTGTASISLYDITAEKNISTSAFESTTPDANGICNFLLLIPYTEEMNPTHKYSFRVTSGEKSIDVAEYDSYYTNLGYNASVISPSYIALNDTLFAGDTSLSFSIYASAYSNVSLDNFQKTFETLVHVPSETGTTITKCNYVFTDNEWCVTFHFASGLKLGEYRYTFNGQANNFRVLSAETIVLGYSNYSNGAIIVSNNANLPTGSYTGTLYQTISNAYEKVSDLTLVLDPSGVLQASTGKPLPGGSYAMDVKVDNVYLDTVTFNVSEDASSSSSDAVITGYAYQRIQTGEEEYTREWTEVTYLTESSEVYLTAYLKDHAYVRFSEDKTFTGVSYRSIREDMYCKLSDGNGEKTIYVQFKKSSGEESRVYSWTCKKVDSIVDPAIVSVGLEIDGYALGTTRVPNNTDFSLHLTSTSMLNMVSAQFIEANGNSHYRDFPLSYVSLDADGYKYSCSLNSGDYPFDDDFYTFASVTFYLVGLSSNDVLDTETLPISFGETPGLYLDAWGENYSLYINQSDFLLTGGAAPGAEVTIKVDYTSYTVIADAKTGAFSLALMGLAEDSYRITVDDGEEYKSCWLYVDLTKPVITSLKAVLADNGNAAVTWDCAESNLHTYLLYRDDVLIKGTENLYSYNTYTDKNYIAVNAAGASFSLVAIDLAGNRSDVKQISVGDTEPPTAPGIPTMTAHTTKSVSFSWEAATDNIAVYQYEIYRDSELIKTLAYTETSYVDTNLEENSTYTYSVYALDRAGNKSEAAAARLSTAQLTVTDNTDWSDEAYIIEAYEEYGISLMAEIGVDEVYHDLTTASVMFLYSADGTQTPTEVEMTAKGSLCFGTWDISKLEAGTYTVSFRVSDAQGTQKSTDSRTVTLVHDTIPPEVTIIKPTAKDAIGGTETPEVSFTATDNILVSGVKLYYKTVEGEKTLFADLTNEANANTFTDTIDFEEAAELESGLLVLTAEACDTRGNIGTATVSVMLDNTAPAAPENFYVESDANKISVKWSKTTREEDFSHFNIYRSTSADGEFTKVKFDDGIGYFDDNSTGINLTDTYYYYVTCVDTLGNESAPTAVDFGKMVTDNEAPSVVSFLPKTGSTLCHSRTLSVSAEDNFKLAKIRAEYYDAANGKWIVIGEKTMSTKTAVASFDWALTELTPDTYQVRFTAVDSVGNTSEAVTASYTVEAYTAPVKPVLTVTAGHRTAELAWTYAGNTALVQNYEILRSDAEDGTYAVVGRSSSLSFTNQVPQINQTYWYKVRVLDKYDGKAESEPVSVTVTLSDSEAPVACITLKDCTIALGSSLHFDGSGSTDNDLIASYAWDFGDDSKDNGKSVNHTFAAAGTYTALLTVTDASGNSNSTTASVTVVDMTVETDYLYATFTVVEGSDGTTPIRNAEIQISTEDGAQLLSAVTTADNGKVTVLLKKGAYTVHTIAGGHMGRTAKVMITEENCDILIGLGGSGSIKGSLTATEMTLEEILEAGIDVDDPENQHIYRGALVLTFVQIDKSLSFNVYYDANGRILRGGGGAGGGGGGGGGGGFGFNFGGLCGTVYPMSKNAYMIVYTEVCWLKEMFNVELVVINDSAVDTMNFTTATLNLPDGLSLASMKVGEQNETILLGTIAPKESSTATWYVRGDKEGEYYLSADVTGTFSPNWEDFEVRFTTLEPIKVWAGSALTLHIEAEKYAAKGQNYRIRFTLENVSNKDLYNVSLKVLGGRILDKYGIEDLEYEGDGGDLDGVWNGGNGAIKAEVFKPGEKLSGVFKIVFDADFMEEDAEYILTNMFMHTMEGSTTEINITYDFIDREDLAIIVVPGIMGSELITADDGTQVWIPDEFNPYAYAFLYGRYGDLVKHLLGDLLSKYVADTAGDAEAKGFFGRKWDALKEVVQEMNVTLNDGKYDNITIYEASSGQTGTAETCATMMRAMKSITSNVYLFSYDWRNDNRVSAEKLKDLILQIRSDETIKDVVIVAHSMGGLVTSSYVSKYGTKYLPVDYPDGTIPEEPENDCITNIVTVGTPYYGATQGTYMLELLDNLEKPVGQMLSDLCASILPSIISNVFGLQGIEALIAQQIIKPFVKPVTDAVVAPEITSFVEPVMEDLSLDTLAHYYKGLYQLIPTPAFGGHMIDEDSNRFLSTGDERIYLNSMMEHYEDNSDHVQLITDAFDFHEELGEADSRHQVLLGNPKAYFIVGTNERTPWTLTPTTERDPNSFKFDHTFKDLEVGDGDGTVPLRSASMLGRIPDERSLYVQGTSHMLLFGSSTVINAIKDLIYEDETAFGTTSEFDPLDSYIKVKAECPVDLTITRGNETLNSSLGAHNSVTSFGELYLLGSDLDIKVAFLDNDTYAVELNASDSGEMDLTIDYHTGGANDTVKTVMFTNVPLVKRGQLVMQLTANDGDPASDNGLTLGLDNNGDGTVDSVLQPGDASDDSGSDDDDNEDGNEGGNQGGNGGNNQPNPDPTPDPTPDPVPPADSGSTQTPAKPDVNTGAGGNTEADTNGNLVITPDDGFVVDQILVNGKPVTVPANGILTELKPTDRVEVSFAPATVCNGGPNCPSAKFNDVDSSKWYHESIDYVVSHGLMKGTGSSAFSPDLTTSRGMIVTILWRLESKPDAGVCPFTDVEAGSYYEQAIAWAAENGIVNGFGPTIFRPDDTITREQFAAILYRYAKNYKGYDVSASENIDILSYNDAFAISEYALPAMQWACGAGLMNGSNGSLLPDNGATRAQAAALLHRFCIKILR